MKLNCPYKLHVFPLSWETSDILRCISWKKQTCLNHGIICNLYHVEAEHTFVLPLTNAECTYKFIQFYVLKNYLCNSRFSVKQYCQYPVLLFIQKLCLHCANTLSGRSDVSGRSYRHTQDRLAAPGDSQTTSKCDDHTICGLQTKEVSQCPWLTVPHLL